MQDAVYADAVTGLELRFRPAESWEQAAMTKHVMEMPLPDGRVLWGEIDENMGTSRDVGRLFLGCARPGPEDAPLDDAVAEDCQVWEGVVYALVDGKVDYTPMFDEPAPQSLILSDVGRKLRYAVFSAPGEEPWDQFTFKSCSK